MRIAVSSRKQQAADQAMFRHLGVEPTEHAVLALKSSVHFRADFGALARRILVVEAPGPNLADPARLPFRHLRPGMRVRPRADAFLHCNKSTGVALDRLAAYTPADKNRSHLLALK